MSDSHKTIEQQAAEWSVKLSGDDVDKAVLDDFNSWKQTSQAHQDAFARSEQIWQGLTQLEHLRPLAKLPSAKQTKSNWFEKLISWLPSRPAYQGALGILSVLLVGVFVYLTLPGQKETSPAIAPVVISTDQQINEATLADGSQITLAPATTVRVSINEKTREVELVVGEVFFQVAHDKNRPFTVTTESVQTRVLGTVFNVKRFGKQVKVAVKSGHVRVEETQNQNSLADLTQGQGVETNLNGSEKTLFAVDANSVGAWKSNRLTYNDATLKELVADLNRYSDKKIILASPELETLRITLSADINELDSTLDDISQLLPVSINRERPTSIIISPK